MKKLVLLGLGLVTLALGACAANTDEDASAQESEAVAAKGRIDCAPEPPEAACFRDHDHPDVKDTCITSIGIDVLGERKGELIVRHANYGAATGELPNLVKHGGVVEKFTRRQLAMQWGDAAQLDLDPQGISSTAPLREIRHLKGTFTFHGSPIAVDCNATLR